MGEKLNRILDWLILVGTIIVMVLVVSCTKEEDIISSVVPTLELDGRLPLDDNGYYHLTLNPTTNQTIHRISGKVLNTTEPTKVSWWSNLPWELNGEVVPTINSSSYVSDSGEINTVIAPIYRMRYDTLTVKSTINEWYITQTIKIVLD